MINEISAYKCSLYIKILIDVGFQGLTYPNLKNFYKAAKKKTREELFSELIHLQFETFPSGSPQFIDSYLAILGCIGYQIDHYPNFNIKQAVIDHFSQIVKLGFISEAVHNDLIKLIQKVVEKNTVIMNYHPSELEKRYEHIKNEYSDVKNQLEKIRRVFAETSCIVEFFSFINFVYEAKKSKEEQDKERELARKKAEEELLNHSQQKRKHKPKKKKKIKKESEISDKRSEDVVNSIQDIVPITSSKSDLPQTLSDKKEYLEEDRNKELCEELSNLIHLKFPDERSKKFEEEIKQAISREEKNQQLYKTIIDFYLSRVRYKIKDYSAKYSKHIVDTKDKFGTPDFDYQINKFITQNLSNIASTIRGINSDLQEVFVMLDKITPLIYESQHDQQQSETWLEITGSDTLLIFKEFLTRLENLGEWRDNKLEYVTKNNVRRKSAKTKSERENEKRAIEDIKLCVKLLESFYSKYISKRNNDLPQLSDQVGNESEKAKCSTSEEDANYYLNAAIVALNSEEWPPLQSPSSQHQQWCSLRLTEVEITKLSTELRKCSC